MGSINQDFVLAVERRPQPGETVTDAELTLLPGGKGANVAVAAARLGAAASMLGRVGEDAFGQSLVENLRENGVDVKHVRTTSDAPTGSAFITVTPDGENAIVVSPGANRSFGPGARGPRGPAPPPRPPRRQRNRGPLPAAWGRARPGGAGREAPRPRPGVGGGDAGRRRRGSRVGKRNPALSRPEGRGRGHDRGRGRLRGRSGGEACRRSYAKGGCPLRCPSGSGCGGPSGSAGLVTDAGRRGRVRRPVAR